MIGLAVVDLRGRTAHHAHEVYEHYRRQRALQRQVWRKQLELTSLRSPQQIRRRVGELGLEMYYPGQQLAQPGSKPPAPDAAAPRQTRLTGISN